MATPASNENTSSTPGFTSEQNIVPGTSQEVCKVGVRIPPFWPEEPEIWFAQIEGQFAITGITSDATKFHYVVGQLENKYSREVKDLIIKPPATDKYQTLKSELIRRLTASKEKKTIQLLHHEELGDRKPSQFLRHLRGLASADIPNDFLKTIWMSRLPVGIQQLIASQPASSGLDDLATLADQVLDISLSSPNVAATSLPSTPGSVLNELVHEVAELRRQLQHLSMQRDRSPRSRSRNGDRRRNRSSSRTRSQSSYRTHPLCFYHSRFGSKARDCIKPCDFEASSSSAAENYRGSR